MEENPNIEKLGEIAPVVASAGRGNIYSVPDGYFDSLAELILGQIRLLEIRHANPYIIPAEYFDSLASSIIGRIRLEEVKQVEPYSVPDDYFDSLADLIISKINLEEIKHINPYSIPDNYFNFLEETILSTIRLSELKHSTPYFVPAQYFENFADSVLDKIKFSTSEVYEELSEVAPLLNTIDKSNILSIPQGYFNELLPAAVKSKPRVTKVVSLGSHARKWTTYAAAACVLFIIAATTYLYVDVHGRSFEEHLPIEQRISQLDEQEIMNYLKNDDGITSGDVISTSAEQDPEIEHLLNNASDEDIQNYLDEYSDPDESTDSGI